MTLNIDKNVLKMFVVHFNATTMRKAIYDKYFNVINHH